MAKFLIEARYSPDGAKGLVREGGSGRRASVEKMAASVGARVESFYFAFGDVDAYVILDAPDNVSVAALSLAVNQTGAASAKAVVLMTPEELDQASKKSVDYRAPGR